MERHGGGRGRAAPRRRPAPPRALRAPGGAAARGAGARRPGRRTLTYGELEAPRRPAGARIAVGSGVGPEVRVGALRRALAGDASSPSSRILEAGGAYVPLDPASSARAPGVHGRRLGAIALVLVSAVRSPSGSPARGAAEPVGVAGSRDRRPRPEARAERRATESAPAPARPSTRRASPTSSTPRARPAARRGSRCRTRALVNGSCAPCASGLGLRADDVARRSSPAGLRRRRGSRSACRWRSAGGSSVRVAATRRRRRAPALARWSRRAGVTAAAGRRRSPAGTSLLERVAGGRPASGALGGEALSRDPGRPARLRAGRPRLVNLYGPTETTDLTSTGTVVGPDEARAARRSARPIADTRVYLVDRAGCAGAGRRRRASCWIGGAGRGARLPRPARASPPSASCPTRWAASAGRAPLPHRRPRAPAGRRRARVPRPHRPPGQGARLPHRAGGDRGGARAPPGGAPSGGGRVRGRGAGGERRLVAYVVPAGARQPAAPTSSRARARRAAARRYMVPVGLRAPSPPCRSPRTARSTAGALAPAAPAGSGGGEPGRLRRRGRRSRRLLAGIWARGPRAATGWASTTTSSSWAATRSSRSRWWRGRAGAGLAHHPAPALRAPDDRRRSPRAGAPARRPGAAAARRSGDGAGRGPVPLTPIQRWFLARRPADPHHFNQALLLDRPPSRSRPRALAGGRSAAPRSPTTTRSACASRRGRGRRAGGRSTAAPGAARRRPERARRFARVDLSALPPAAPAARPSRRRPRRSRRGSTSPAGRSSPPLWLDLARRARPASSSSSTTWSSTASPGGSSSRTWRPPAAQLRRRRAPSRCRAKTTSFRRWAERARRRTRAPGAARGAAPRPARAAPREARRALPRDPATVRRRRRTDRAPAARRAARRRERRASTRRRRRALLRRGARGLPRRADDLLLAALRPRASRRRTGARRVLSRRSRGTGARSSSRASTSRARSAGSPASSRSLLDAAGGRGPGDALRAVKEQLRAVPGRGLGYGLLRYLRRRRRRPRRAARPPRGRLQLPGPARRGRCRPERRRSRPGRGGGAGARSPRGAGAATALDVDALVPAAGSASSFELQRAASSSGRRSSAWPSASPTACGRSSRTASRPSRRGRRAATPSRLPARAASTQRGARPRLAGAPSGAARHRGPLSALAAPGGHPLPHASTRRGSGRLPRAAGAARSTAPLDAGGLRARPGGGWSTGTPILRTSFALGGGLPRAAPGRAPRGRGRRSPGATGGASPAAEQRGALAPSLPRPPTARARLRPRAAPLMRWRSCAPAEREHRLLWSFHHLLLDGWSFAVLVAEVVRRLRGAARRGATPRPAGAAALPRLHRLARRPRPRAARRPSGARASPASASRRRCPPTGRRAPAPRAPRAPTSARPWSRLAAAGDRRPRGARGATARR